MNRELEYIFSPHMLSKENLECGNSGIGDIVLWIESVYICPLTPNFLRLWTKLRLNNLKTDSCLVSVINFYNEGVLGYTYCNNMIFSCNNFGSSFLG